jgi:hypothetical protein
MFVFVLLFGSNVSFCSCFITISVIVLLFGNSACHYVSVLQRLFTFSVTQQYLICCSSLKLVYIFSVNPYLGPLQVSLSRMVLDIMKFFFLYVLVLFAFSCGKYICSLIIAKV